MVSSALDESWEGTPWKSIITLKLSNCIAFLAGIISLVIEVCSLLQEIIKTLALKDFVCQQEMWLD